VTKKGIYISAISFSIGPSFLWGIFPAQILTIIYPDMQSLEYAFGFSYLLSGGMNYKLPGKLYLKLDVFYFGTSKLIFKKITQNFTSTYGGLRVPGVYTLSNSNLTVFSESSKTDPNKQPLVQ
jgi:hypothetical protein